MASYKKTTTGWSVRVSRRENGKLRQVFKSGFATKNEAKDFAHIVAVRPHYTNMGYLKVMINLWKMNN